MKSYWKFENETWICANCNTSTFPHFNPTPYCPHCGSLMLNCTNDELCSAFRIIEAEERCLGTKEIELCDCDGDPRKCNFYDKGVKNEN